MKRILLVILKITVIIVGCSGCHSKQKGTSKNDDYYISTQSETDDFVKRLNMDKSSEDASDILDIKKLDIPNTQSSALNADVKKAQVIDEFNQSELIELKSDTPFNGKLVWDVLQSVGLKWGDGDLFHWPNPKRDYGDDQLFSVWTTTDPGYFLPQNIKKGELAPANLLFGFSIPRNADPKHVFEVMINVTKYCNKRLGGRILNKNQQPFNEYQEKRDLELLIKKMNANGLVPGSHKALMTY